MLKAGAQKHWQIGLAVAIGALVLLCGIGLATQSFGFFFVLGAPIVCGFIIGRWVQVKRVVQVLLGLIVLGSIVFGAVTVSLAGAVCGSVFAAIACGPLVLGVFVGSKLMRKSGPSSSMACVALVALLIPLEHAALPRRPIESLSTSEVVQLTQGQAFSHITFYEDTSEEPPRILRIALPRPLRTIGPADHVGDRPRCVYDKGYIVKEITAVKAPTFYSFRVLEQVGVESHAVKLVGGSFRLKKLGPHETLVTLTTRYVPKLTARLVWRPFEQAVIRALHHHVIRAMMR